MPGVFKCIALVCIAALLGPLHHKVEKWATAKLVEKNKQIRLASTNKTIEELEKGDIFIKKLDKYGIEFRICPK